MSDDRRLTAAAAKAEGAVALMEVGVRQFLGLDSRCAVQHRRLAHPKALVCRRARQTR